MSLSLTPQIPTPTGKKAISYYPNYAVYARALEPSAIDYAKQGNLVHAFLNLKEKPVGSGLWQFVSSDTYADGLDDYSKVYLSTTDPSNVILNPSKYGTVGYSIGNIRQEIAEAKSQRGYEITALNSSTTGGIWRSQQNMDLFNQTPVDMTKNACAIAYDKFINVQKDIFNQSNIAKTLNTYNKVCLAGQLAWVLDDTHGKYKAGMFVDPTLNQVNNGGEVYDCANIPVRYLCCRDETGPVQQCAVCYGNQHCNGLRDGSIQDGNVFCKWDNAPECQNSKILNKNRMLKSQTDEAASLTAQAAQIQDPPVNNNGVAICQSCNQNNSINAGSQAVVLNNMQTNAQTCSITGAASSQIPTVITTPSTGSSASQTDANGISHLPTASSSTLPAVTASGVVPTTTTTTVKPASTIHWSLVYIFVGIFCLLNTMFVLWKVIRSKTLKQSRYTPLPSIPNLFPVMR